MQSEYRRLPHRERAIIERKKLQSEAAIFVKSADFIDWADMTGLEPTSLRKVLTNGRNS